MSVPHHFRAARPALARAVTILTALLTVATAAGAHGEKLLLQLPPDFDGRVLARVNDAVITGRAFHHAFEALPPESQGLMRQSPRKLLEVLIHRELLYQEALRAGLDRDPVVQERLDQMRRAVMIQEMSRRERARAGEAAGPEAVRRYYEAHREQFTAKERISASHILLETRDEAEAAAARLRSGADFAALAQEVSRDEKTRTRGGRLFIVHRGQLSPELERAAFELETGQVSGIVEDADGYHIILLHEHVPASVTRYEAVQAMVQRKAASVEGERRLRELIADLERRARLEVNDQALTDVK